jgi:hypothetical protein
MTTLHLRRSIGLSQLRRGLLLIPLVLVCFALSPSAQAVVPAPDGAYPGFNTAEGGPSALGQAVPGVWNTAIGQFALNLDVSGGTGNTAVGLNALRANTLGDFNSALGVNALRFNVIGSNNTALGYQALFVNTGAMNTAVGVNALANNTTGANNTAVGQGALGHNTTAANNVATGFRALGSNTIGGAPSGAFLSAGEVGPNTAVGPLALTSNIDAGSNTAVGYLALGSMASGSLSGANTTRGGYSTAVGFEALASAVGGPMAGIVNDAFGYQALANLTTGALNVGIGSNALFNATSGFGNVAIGVGAGNNVTGASNVTAINNLGANISNTTWISNVFNKTTTSATTMPVIVSNTGQLGTTPSSRRFKDEIKPMDKASDAILGLKPVTFHYKSDSTGTPQFGLIAEEVAQVNPDLVVRDDKGEIYSVRYDAVNAMLLNEFLKEHRKVEEQARKMQEQEATITQLKDGVKALTASLKDQASQIQKVSDQLELSKSAPRVVGNNQ